MSQFESRYAHAHHLRVVADLSMGEALSAMDRHGPYHSWHEVLGVLSEEFCEFTNEVFAKQQDPKGLYSEAIQVAGIALRAAVIAKRQMLAEEVPE